MTKFYGKTQAELNNLSIEKGLIFIKPPRVSGGSIVLYLYKVCNKNGIKIKPNKKGNTEQPSFESVDKVKKHNQHK